jgi:hypothetical protein
MGILSREGSDVKIHQNWESRLGAQLSKLAIYYIKATWPACKLSEKRAFL